jgi:choline oxidase
VNHSGGRYDYVVVGGGTAGAVVAARVAERSEARVCLLEAGPSDENEPRVLELREWPSLLGSELDYDYVIEPQPRGNSRIRHSRGRVLGGCSSHNSAIAFRAPDADLRRWVELGADGWSPEEVDPFFGRVWDKVHIRQIGPDNECAAAFVAAGREAGFPLKTFNRDDFGEGVGFFQINARGPIRQSSSVAYLHPLMEVPSNLAVMTDVEATQVVIDSNGEATGVHTRRGFFSAAEEVVVCCGAFDTPKLLMLSGVGPSAELKRVGIACLVDLPGVGEHLLDHPEGVVMWEAARAVPDTSTQLWEAGLFARSAAEVAEPDLMVHFGTVPFDMNTAPLGYPSADDAFCITPNVMYARSEGSVRLRSEDPDAPPVVDPRYFTDPEGHDERVMVAGIKLARRLAGQPSLAPWIQRELAPGPALRSDEELSEYARRTANTVYHPAGTCRMGPSGDSDVVVDSNLRVRGVKRLRVADASVFPALLGINPCITCMMIGERCAHFLLEGTGRSQRALAEGAA